MCPKRIQPLDVNETSVVSLDLVGDFSRRGRWFFAECTNNIVFLGGLMCCEEGALWGIKGFIQCLPTPRSPNVFPNWMHLQLDHDLNHLDWIAPA